MSAKRMMHHTLAAALAAVFASGALADGAKTSELGTITITGEGDKLGSGLLQQEDSGRARSNVSRSSLEKERPTANPFQTVNQLPGINAVSTDASGLFGGQLNLRGFNSDQIGFTVNGVPVNDSGSFAVYPQEFTDNENLCQQFVTQGSTDTDAPHIGATGGNMGFVTCDPEDKGRVRIMQTYGSNRLSKTFARFDTGRVMNDMAKFYVSFSHAEVDKWKGLGSARRDHVDTGFRLDLGAGNYLTGSFLWNNAVNNNFYNPTLAEVKNDYFIEYTTTPPGHLTPVNGKVQDESTIARKPEYYKLALNPFRNLIASVNGVFKLSDKATLKVSPYFWYGFGTGGTQQYTLKETGSVLNNGTKGNMDLNGDKDTIDTIIVASSSVTRTLRPGVTVSLNYLLDKHNINGGIWFERATHRQTGPAVPVDNGSNPVDVWLQSGQITRPDGTPYQSRDWKTITTAIQPFAQDTWSLLDDNLVITGGARYAHVKRDFNNFANEGLGPASAKDYQVSKSYNQFLPSLSARYNVTPAQQVFGSVVKNFRAPPNFAYSPTNGNVALVNGKVIQTNEVKPETSVNFELGYRYQAQIGSVSATLFRNNYKDRQLTWKDQTTNSSYYINAGDGVNQGLELEAGTAPFNGVSAYVSYTRNVSSMNNDLQTTAGVLPIKDKKFPMTPDQMAALTLQYATGPFFARTKMKYTGRQQTTLTNDEAVAGYTTFDLDVGYQFAKTAFFKNPKIQANVTNLTSKRYWTPSGPGVNAQKVGNIAGSAPRYLVGQPRSVSVTVSSDF